MRGVAQQLRGFVSRMRSIIAESGFQMESAITCYTVEIFCKESFSGCLEVQPVVFVLACCVPLDQVFLF